MDFNGHRKDISHADPEHDKMKITENPKSLRFAGLRKRLYTFGLIGGGVLGVAGCEDPKPVQSHEEVRHVLTEEEEAQQKKYIEQTQKEAAERNLTILKGRYMPVIKQGYDQLLAKEPRLPAWAAIEKNITPEILEQLSHFQSREPMVMGYSKEHLLVADQYPMRERVRGGLANERKSGYVTTAEDYNNIRGQLDHPPYSRHTDFPVVRIPMFAELKAARADVRVEKALDVLQDEYSKFKLKKGVEKPEWPVLEKKITPEIRAALSHLDGPHILEISKDGVTIVDAVKTPSLRNNNYATAYAEAKKNGLDLISEAEYRLLQKTTTVDSADLNSSEPFHGVWLDSGPSPKAPKYGWHFLELIEGSAALEIDTLKPGDELGTQSVPHEFRVRYSLKIKL